MAEKKSPSPLRGQHTGRGPWWRRRSAWGAVILLVLSSGVLAQTQGSIPSARPDEPITPLPEPAAADPLKLALGERLFLDRRLSHDGSRSCSSCHDMRTSGADRNQRAPALDGSKSLLNT